jgi:hypothetical protein
MRQDRGVQGMTGLGVAEAKVKEISNPVQRFMLTPAGLKFFF